MVWGRRCSRSISPSVAIPYLSKIRMTKEELVQELRVHINDLKDTIDQSGAVRSSVERDFLTENEAIDDQVTLVYSLIQKSEAISSLIDNFFDSSPSDRELVDRANH